MSEEAVRPNVGALDLTVRIAGMVAYAVGLWFYIQVFGLPKQAIEVVICIWLGTVAWDVRRPVREHLIFLRDWWPPFVVFLAYLYSRGLSDDLGIFSVHVTAPADGDRWLFGGTLPTEFLQQHLCGSPCDRSMSPRWYDVALTTVYYSHFFAALGVGAFLWKRNRPAWVRYMRRYLTVISVGVICFVVYPAAPPWMASRDGAIPEDVNRITGRGWFDLASKHGSGGTAQQHVSAVGNQVAAMPSLHAALAILVALWGVTHLRSHWRWVLLLYPAAMMFMLVYYAEHYVVDEIAGALLVVVVMAGWTLWERSRPSREVEEEPQLFSTM
ncbi:inositol phosphorylceramide synthase [Nocardioides humilatus]|uniref:Inositol phosphorylceramide synthase n=1 Tax=Nocardioides humilatus TaxID=2607660 RepID=A0A5B1LIK9_9ACTN|nr:phosphatase PAP2 family protein [Nocardioides humilatus]KAA1419399.1 inositol phosphorylceramide synthase [Nocardioides humilatus]